MLNPQSELYKRIMWNHTMQATVSRSSQAARSFILAMILSNKKIIAELEQDQPQPL